MRVYVAGRYSRNTKGQPGNILEVFQNIQMGTQVCAMLMKRGFDVFCPWLDFQFLWYQPDMPKSRFYEQSLAFLEVCDAMLVISGEGACGGVDKEIKFAADHGIPIYRDIQELVNTGTYTGNTGGVVAQCLGPDGRDEQEA